MAGAAAPAIAHREAPGLTTVLDRITPELPDGVTIQVAESAATQLVAENTTDTPLVVLGAGDRPFLRISRAGVEADLTSPDFVRSNNPDGAAGATPTSAEAAPFRWISTEPSWGWFDHRLHGEAALTPEPGVVDRWTVPMLYGDQRVAVSGHRAFRRPAGQWVPEVSDYPDGINVSVAAGRVPALLLTLNDDMAVVVEGEDGEPMIRMTSGRVEVNDASPTWSLTGRGTDGFTFAVDATGEAWRLASLGRSLTWLEPRATPPPRGTAPVRWRIPVAIDGEPAQIVGETRFVPADATATGPVPMRRNEVWKIAAVIVLGLGLASMVAGFLTLRWLEKRRS